MLNIVLHKVASSPLYYNKKPGEPLLKKYSCIHASYIRYDLMLLMCVKIKISKTTFVLLIIL